MTGMVVQSSLVSMMVPKRGLRKNGFHKRTEKTMFIAQKLTIMLYFYIVDGYFCYSFRTLLTYMYIGSIFEKICSSALLIPKCALLFRFKQNLIHLF